jgi:ornithine cyclodeaminase/alanine dehydrogenase-like protein (mu-crystallin family)
MTLFINNKIVEEVLTMQDTIDALEKSYRQMALKEAVCRPRVDIQIPTSDAGKIYQWGTMEGGSQSGYFAVRMKSDVIYEQEYNGAITQEKYCTRPGMFCGLILLTSTKTGEPLAFINDGVLQHMRVGADGGIGVKYMSREDSAVVGMLGSGGMACTHMEAFMCVRKLKKLQVYSPTPAHREAFAEEMGAKYGIEAVVCDNPRDVYRGADIIAGVTDSAVPVLNGDWVEKGCHVVNVGGGGGKPDQKTLDKVDVYLRFGNAPGPWGQPDMALEDEFITYAAQPAGRDNFRMKRSGKRGHGAALPDRMVTLKDIFEGTNRGRSAASQVTYSERGNLQGAQFWAVGAVVYEKARERGLGNEIPTEWLLQDIRD